MWADRILQSAIAEQLLSSGAADQVKLQAISLAWQQWADHPDGYLMIPHSQILCRV
jgi:hypothetical protein